MTLHGNGHIPGIFRLVLSRKLPRTALKMTGVTTTDGTSELVP